MLSETVLLKVLPDVKEEKLPSETDDPKLAPSLLKPELLENPLFVPLELESEVPLELLMLVLTDDEREVDRLSLTESVSL